MQEILYASEPLPPVVAPFRRGRPGLAWLVIVACVVTATWMQMRRPARTAAIEAADDDGLVVMQVQGRYLVGVAEILKQSGHDPAAQAVPLNTGGPGQRLRYAILIGELSGPAQARELLQKLHAPQSQPELRQTLLHLYDDYAADRWDAPSVDEAQRQALRARLGWFGDLALAPAKGSDNTARDEVMHAARKTSYAMMGIAGGVFVLTVVGAAVLFFVVFWLFNGRLMTHFLPGSAAGGLYAETFAIWMLLFMTLSVVASLIPGGQWRFAVLGIAMLLSLAALGWPVLRGLTWRQVCQEVGLTLGYRPRLEPLLGPVTWTMAIPLVVLGLGVTLVLMKLQQGLHVGQPGSGPASPSHPIVEALGGLGFWGRVQILLLVSVVAPIVEETMFRGVLYRHLREASLRLGRIGSILYSGTVVSFIFAVIHPQGLVAVPLLMALAYAFTLAREWRGTLIPAMVAHGIQNGVTLLMVTQLLGA